MPFQDPNPLRDITPVEFDLLLARAAGLAQAAALAFEVGPAAHQARREVLQLREFHLQLSLAGPGTLREDVEDQLGAVEHPAAELFFEIALLPRREAVVEDHGRRVDLVCSTADLLDLAAAGIEAGIGPVAAAANNRAALRAGAFGEARDFRDAVLVAVVAEIQADEDGGGGVGGPAEYCDRRVEQTGLGVRLDAEVDRPRG